MLERSRYVTDEDIWVGSRQSGNKIGMVHVIEDGGCFGVGWSLCHEDDKFDMVEAKFIARGRAVKDLLENERKFKDLVNCKTFRELGIKIPGNKSWATDRALAIFSCNDINNYTRSAFDSRLRLCIEDIICTCALEYLKAEEASLVVNGEPPADA